VSRHTRSFTVFQKNPNKLHMNMKKNLFVLAGIMLLAVSAYSQIKVACIGNSITYGYGIQNREVNSYPAQLQKMLGQEWEVKNFGVNGATLLKQGDKPYVKQTSFEDAKSYIPDVIIIKLGTNDTKPGNWKFKEEFVSDYSAMINEFRALSSKPLVILCFPVPAYPERWGIRDSIITVELIPYIKKVAKQTKTELIDLYKPLSNHASWFPDKIHPNIEGARKMAEIVSKKLLKLKKKIVKRNR